MSSIFDLQKRTEQVQFNLEKRGIKQAPTMRVGAVFDVSGSTHSMFTSGIMQKTLDRLVPVAMKFDDNGELDCWSFDSGDDELTSVTKFNLDGYIKKEIIDNSRISKWGGTCYAGVMDRVVNKYFPSLLAQTAGSATSLIKGLFGKKEPAVIPAENPQKPLPAMVLFITDGASNDSQQAARVLRNAQTKNVYWQMIGVGNPSSFTFLQDMADELPNVGFVSLASLDITDEALYEALISDELCEWIKK